MAAVFMIPSNYDEAIDKITVPICIRAKDDEGNAVHAGWIERGVVPVAERLVELAGRMLHDRCRVSEITEPVVHRLSLDCGSNLGGEPSLRVLKGVHWYAEDLRVGGRRARRKTEVELFSRTMEAVEDQFDLENQVAAQRTLARLSDQLMKMDLHEVRAMLPMMLLECDADDYRQRFSKSRNSISQQFYRSMRQAARAAGVNGWMHESK